MNKRRRKIWARILSFILILSMILPTFSFAEEREKKDKTVTVKVIRKCTGGPSDVSQVTLKLQKGDWSDTETISGNMDGDIWTGTIEVPVQYADETLTVTEVVPEGWTTTPANAKFEGGETIPGVIHAVEAKDIHPGGEYVIVGNGNQVFVAPGRSGTYQEQSYENCKAWNYIWTVDESGRLKNKDGYYLAVTQNYNSQQYLYLTEDTQGCSWKLIDGNLNAVFDGGYNYVIYYNSNPYPSYPFYSIAQFGNAAQYVPENKNITVYEWVKEPDKTTEKTGSVTITITKTDDDSDYKDDKDDKDDEKDKGNTYGEGIDLPISKTVYREGKDNYKLQLTATGLSKTMVEKAPLDVIFVVDTTGSMMSYMDPSQGDTGNNPTRWSALTDAYKSSINILSEKADTRVSMVTFSALWGEVYQDASLNLQWMKMIEETNKNRVKTALDELSLGGSTNYEAAFYEINKENLVENMRPEAAKVIIFLTDGFPNQFYAKSETNDGYNGIVRYQNNSFEWRRGNRWYSYGDIENLITKGLSIYDATSNAILARSRAKEELAKVNGVDAFYSIGVSAVMGNPESGGTALLEDLQKSANASVKKTYVSSDKEKLKKDLEEISNRITSKDVQNASINDPLSEDVQPVDDTQIKIEVVDNKNEVVQVDGRKLTAEGSLSEGARLTLEDGHEMTAIYDKNSRTFKAKFSDDYKVKKEWDYRISMNIEPTQAAREKYGREGAEQKDHADKETGTYEDQDGIFTNKNEETYFSYTFGGKGHHQKYKKPVIQIDERKNLTIKKEWKGSKAPVDSIYVDIIKKDNSIYKTVTLTNNNNWETTIEVPAGGEYTAKEKAYDSHYIATYSMYNKGDNYREEVWNQVKRKAADGDVFEDKGEYVIAIQNPENNSEYDMLRKGPELDFAKGEAHIMHDRHLVKPEESLPAERWTASKITTPNGEKDVFTLTNQYNIEENWMLGVAPKMANGNVRLTKGEDTDKYSYGFKCADADEEGTYNLYAVTGPLGVSKKYLFAYKNDVGGYCIQSKPKKKTPIKIYEKNEQSKSFENNTIVITNTYTDEPVEDVHIGVKKIWHDAGSGLTRPESISVKVLQNGNEKIIMHDGNSKTPTVTLSEKNAWVWDALLPKYDKEGKAYTYRFEENGENAGYTAAYKYYINKDVNTGMNSDDETEFFNKYCEITNTAIYNLPSTGSLFGTWLYTVFGTFFMASAVLFFKKEKH